MLQFLLISFVPLAPWDQGETEITQHMPEDGLLSQRILSWIQNG